MNWASQHTLRVFVLETTLYLYHIASNKYFISGADLGTAFGSDKTQESLARKKKSNTTKSGPDNYPACRFNLGSVIAEYCIDKRQKNILRSLALDWRASFINGEDVYNTQKQRAETEGPKATQSGWRVVFGRSVKDAMFVARLWWYSRLGKVSCMPNHVYDLFTLISSTLNVLYV